MFTLLQLAVHSFVFTEPDVKKNFKVKVFITALNNKSEISVI